MNPSPAPGWYFRMAWRDSRRNRGRLFLFVASILAGIAALVSISSFKANLREEIDGEAQALLGADLEVRNNQPPSDSMEAFLKGLGGRQAYEQSFASMVIFSDSGSQGGTRLVNVRALEGDYPFYGTLETAPPGLQDSLEKGRYAIVDRAVMNQFGAEKGDSISVGRQKFQIVGQVLKVPGRAGITSTAAPPVYIPRRYIDRTGLEAEGSRIVYRYYYQFPKGYPIDSLVKSIEPLLNKKGYDYDTVETRKAMVGRIFGFLTNFLNLTGFAALLLGCIGVASSVSIYLREKLPLIAMLRCLGMKTQDGMRVYLIQLMVLGLLGSVLGAALGVGVQMYLPQLVKGLLPFQMAMSLSWPSILKGIGTGLLVSLLAALIPLLSLRKASPLQAIRSSEGRKTRWGWPEWSVLGISAVALYLLTYEKIHDWAGAAYFLVGLAGALLLLGLVAYLLMRGARVLMPRSWPYPLRQGVSNLFRPNNQTLVLLTTLGLGTGLIGMLYFIQGILLGSVDMADREKQPNMLIFDIREEQKQQVSQFVGKQGMQTYQQVPIVAMRLLKVNEHSRAQIKKDSTLDIPDHIVDREYRVTYRDTLSQTEEILEGKLAPQYPDSEEKVYISVSRRLSEQANIGLGDSLLFNVQGARVKAYVGSIREIRFNRVATNFSVVFPAGVLESAPKFWVIITRAANREASGQFQRKLIAEFPNLSVIDLELILNTAEEIINKVTFVIQFMAFFSIITGLLVLGGSLTISKFQRTQEAVTLRTLGASSRQILWIAAVEYFFLGFFAAIAGTGLGLLGSLLLAEYAFQTVMVVPWLAAGLIVLIISGFTLVFGLSNSRGVLNKPPLQILRSE